MKTKVFFLFFLICLCFFSFSKIAYSDEEDTEYLFSTLKNSAAEKASKTQKTKEKPTPKTKIVEKKLISRNKKETEEKTKKPQTEIPNLSEDFELELVETASAENEPASNEAKKIDFGCIETIVVIDSTKSIVDSEKKKRLYQVVLELKKDLLKDENERENFLSLERLFSAFEKTKQVDSYSLNEFMKGLVYLANNDESLKILECVVFPLAKEIDFSRNSLGYFYYYVSRFFEERKDYEKAFQAVTISLSKSENSLFYEQLIKVCKKLNDHEKVYRSAVLYLSYLKDKQMIDQALELSKRMIDYFIEFDETEKLKPFKDYLKNYSI